MARIRNYMDTNYDEEPRADDDVVAPVDSDDDLLEIMVEGYNAYMRNQGDAPWEPDYVPNTALECIAGDLWQEHNDDDIYVVVYAAHRRYGGPEEGGWYYTALEMIGSVGPFSDGPIDERADDALRTLDEYANPASIYNNSDADPSELRRVVRLEIVPQGDGPGKTERNQRRPHYC